MKRIAIIYIAMLSLACWSCSENEELSWENSLNVGNRTLNVSVETPPSRSAIDFYGTYMWSADDTISVFGTKTTNAPYKIVDQTNKGTTFSGHLSTIEESVNLSFYPYDENVTNDGSQIIFELPQKRHVSDWRRAPMVGLVEGTSNLRFYHAGGSLNIRILGLPEHATTLEIKAIGENAPYLSGKAIIDNYKNDFSYHITEGSHQVIYHLSATNKSEDLLQINLPLQIGHYEKLAVTLKDITGTVIKNHSVSDLNIARASMTQMPVINYSNTYYVYQLPEEILSDSDLIDAYVTSDQIFIGIDTLSGSYHYTIAQIQSMQKGNENIAHIYADKDGFIQNVTINNKSVFFDRNENNTVRALIIDGENVEEIQTLDVEIPQYSRSVESSTAYGISQMTTAMGWLSSLGSISELGKGVINAGSWLLGSPLSTAFIPDLTTGMIVGGSISIALGLLTISALPATLTLGGGIICLSAMIGIVAGAYNVAFGAWNGLCQLLFNLICGDMSITTIKPQIVDHMRYDAGYEFKNASKPGIWKNLQEKWFIPECGLIIQTEKINSNKAPHPRLYESNRELNQRVSQLIENSTHGKFEYIHNYKDYLTSYITFEEKNFVTYWGNTELFTTKVDIERISSFSQFINFLNVEEFSFDIDATCNSESEHLPFFLNLYKDGEVLESIEWSRATNTDINFSLSFKPNELSKELTYPGNITLGITTTKGDKENILVSKPIDIKYDDIPSLIIDSLDVSKPRKVSSRAANVDDYYENDFTVKLKYTGGGWFKSYGVKASNGTIYWGSDSEPIWTDESYVLCTGTIKYKDEQSIPTLSCFGTLRNDKTLQGKGTIMFEGMPVGSGSIK